MEDKKEIEFKQMTQEEFSKFIESLPARNIDYSLKESVLERNILELSIAEDRLKMEKINCLKNLLQAYSVSRDEAPAFSEQSVKLSRVFSEEDEYPIKNKIFELIKQL